MSTTLLINRLLSSGFQRTDFPISSPLIIHAVAGAGKTTLLRSLLPFYHCSSPVLDQTLCFTGLVLTAPNDETQILDEYQSLANPSAQVALIGDPLQDSTYQHNFKPHYIKFESFRVGPDVAAILQSVVPIVGLGQTTLHTASAYSVDPEGEVLAFEPAVCDVLRAHHISPRHANSYRGLQWDVVTLYTESATPDLAQFYLAATRATHKLIWLRLCH